MKRVTVVIALLIAGCTTTGTLKPEEQQYADTQAELTVMRHLFNYCAEGLGPAVSDEKFKAAKIYCAQLDNGKFTTESGIAYQRYMMMQVEKARRGDIGKDELIYTIAEKGRELSDRNRRELAEWQRDNPTFTESLQRRIEAGGSGRTAPALPSRPIHCTTMAMPGGLSTTNCN